MSAPAPESHAKGSQPAPADPTMPPPAGQPAASSSSSSASQTLLKPHKPFTALVLGASGATGRVLVGKLANNPRCERINAIVRRELPVDYFSDVKLPGNQAKINQTIVDFDKLSDSKDAFRGYNVAFSCFGTTRSKAGSKEEFKRIDFGGITQFARLAKEAGVHHFGLMSTTGADHTSVFNYLKVKGEIENVIRDEVKFPSYAIFRPGVLLTDRPGESRWGEWFAQKVLPVFHPILPEKHCAVYTQTVAEAMMQQAEHVLATAEGENGGAEGAAAADQIAASLGSTKTRVFENDEIRGLKVAKL